MSEEKKLQKEILDIVKKFARSQQTISDAQRLANILYYEAPIKNRVLPTKFNEEDVIVTVIPQIESDGEDPNLVTAGDHSRDGFIRLSFDAIKNLGEELNTLGHEGTHELQDRVARARALNNTVLSPELKEVVDSYEYGGVAQGNLYGIVNMAANRELNEAYAELNFTNFENMQGEEREQFLNRAKDRLNHISYKQLKYEENARNCGFEYAKEILAAIKSFKQCDAKTRAYIEECEKELSRKWEREENLRNSGTYQTLRELHQASITACANINVQRLAAADLDPTLKSQLETGVLFNLRRAHVSQAEYYRALVAFNRDVIELSNTNSLSYYYLTDCDPKTITIEMLKDGSLIEDFALNNINFILPKDTILLSPDEISDLCLHWAKNGKFNKILSILNSCNYSQNDEMMQFMSYGPVLPVERQEAIKKSISENYQIQDTLDKEFQDLLAKYKAIEGKQITEMTDEELVLCATFIRYQTLQQVREQLGAEKAPELNLPERQCILDEHKRRKEAAKQQESLETPVVEEETSSEETGNEETSSVEETEKDTQEHLEDNPQTEETEEEVEHSTE